MHICKIKCISDLCCSAYRISGSRQLIDFKREEIFAITAFLPSSPNRLLTSRSLCNIRHSRTAYFPTTDHFISKALLISFYSFFSSNSKLTISSPFPYEPRSCGNPSSVSQLFKMPTVLTTCSSTVMGTVLFCES